MLQNRNTTSHYNTSPVEHEWELPRVASESKEKSLLALVNSNYLQTSPFHDFSPFQCGWIFECSNYPLSPSVSRVTGWDEGLQRLKWVWNVPKFIYLFPCFLYKQNFSCCYVLICHCFTLFPQWNLGVTTQNSNAKNHLSLNTPHPLTEQSTAVS